MSGFDPLLGLGGFGEVSTDSVGAVERDGVRVELADEDDRESWDDWVARSPQGTVFHRLAALDVQAEHSGTTLVPLVGYKGEEPVGVFPLFAGSKAGVAAAFSPAPGLWIASLGPALLHFGKLKRRRAEKRHRRFVGAAFEWVDAAIDPKYAHVSAGPRYPDPRPFEWQGFSVRPRHTYVVDLSRDAETLLESFSSDARRNVDTDRDDYEIAVEGVDAVERIVGQVRDRYEQQGETFTLPTEAALDFYRGLPEGVVRPYVCRVDGEFVGGMVVLADGDTIHRWQGGAKHDCDVPVNDLLDWRIIREGSADGYRRYDMEGANEQRLCDYKAKFAPDVVPYYQMERGHPGVRLGSKLYTRLFR